MSKRNHGQDGSARRVADGAGNEEGEDEKHDEYDDEVDPFYLDSGRDVFSEQRLLQDALDTRPERVTYQQMVERASYKASVAS